MLYVRIAKMSCNSSAWKACFVNSLSTKRMAWRSQTGSSTPGAGCEPSASARDSSGGARSRFLYFFFNLLHVRWIALPEPLIVSACNTHVPGRFDWLLLQARQEVIDVPLGAPRGHPPAEGPGTRGSARRPSLRDPGQGESHTSPRGLASAPSSQLPPLLLTRGSLPAAGLSTQLPG